MILAAVLASATPSVAELRGVRRVLVIAAPAQADARFVRQVKAMHDAAPQLDERDVTIVQIVADDVRGAGDTAGALRRRWTLPAAGFTVLLIGKDGHAALRRTAPITAATLIAAIDAMPMRRAGLR